jgi:hypothetical protein
VPDQEEQRALAALTTQLTIIHADVGEMKTALREMTAAITKLALVEQAQAVSAKAQERTFAELKELGIRVTAVERAIPDVTRTSVWLDRGLWAAVAATGMYIAKKVGLL